MNKSGLKYLLFGKSFYDRLEFLSSRHKIFADILLKTYSLAERKGGTGTVLLYNRISEYMILFEKNVSRIISVSKIFNRACVYAMWIWLILGLFYRRIDFFSYITVYSIILLVTVIIDLLTVELYNKAEDHIAIDMTSQFNDVPINNNGHYDMVKDLFSMREFLKDNCKDIDDISEVNIK